MGRATRWFLGLLGGKKLADGGSAVESRPSKGKKRWVFIKSFQEKEKGQQQELCPSQQPEKRKDSCRETLMESISDGDEQGKRANAVAAATAAMAEVAVAAAQAAAAVVRLTNSGRYVGVGTSRDIWREEWVAIKIQAAFRGYLARKALRALRGLVKLQALVRGNIVRKKAAETLRCMQALVRVQSRAHTCRAIRSKAGKSSRSSRSNSVPPTPETMLFNPWNTDMSKSLKRNSSRKKCIDGASKDQNHSAQWNWPDQWIEERYLDAREASKTASDENNAKILEVDTVKPLQCTSERKIKRFITSSSPMNSEQNSLRVAAVPDSPSKDSTAAQQSVPSPCSTIDMHDPLTTLRFRIIKSEDAGDSAQFFSATSHAGSSSRGAFSPTKRNYSRSFFCEYSDCPNYMTNTESSKAKARSLSAPKQRPVFEKSCSIKRSSAHDFSWQRSSLHAKFATKTYMGSGRLDSLGVPMRH